MMVLSRYFCQFGQREGRTSTTDISPRRPPVGIHQYRIHPCLCHITEQRASGDTSSGNQSTDFYLLEGIPIGYQISISFFSRCDLAQSQLIRQRSPGSGISDQFDSSAAKRCPQTGNTPFTTAGSHAQVGRMFDFIYRNKGTVPDHLQYFFQFYIITMANIGGPCCIFQQRFRL